MLCSSGKAHLNGMIKDSIMLGMSYLDGIPPAPRGVPQIAVTLDIDANGILNNGASDKSTGKCNQIIITNGQGWLLLAEIDHMVQEAMKPRGDDEANKTKVEAKDGPEHYGFAMCHTLRRDCSRRFSKPARSTSLPCGRA
ncbi:unnamed protein product [Polarella glacialis]|uniref:Uncharacterized protein n=1 Tax=Polarella glacialis TaxID=89957 RepID=A0A813DR40_POLGL|nr:unnamed protein product [Polarella glacialis]CAE8668522.1 unnamed protein product [Polarella glacialis]